MHAGAPPPQQHQDAPREQGVLNALASRFHPRALRTFLSGGRQRQPQVCTRRISFITCNALPYIHRQAVAPT
eukprot:1156924-Pelagomonas_calceolata.AAC.2